MINYMLLFLSVFFDTFKNIYYNYFGKNVMKGHCDTLLFNEINCIGAVIYFIAGGADLHISPFSLFMALVFGAVTVSAQYVTWPDVIQCIVYISQYADTYNIRGYLLQ